MDEVVTTATPEPLGSRLFLVMQGTSPPDFQSVAKDFRLQFAVELNQLRDLCHGASVQGGWWKLQDFHPDLLKCIVATKVSLIHSEVSEALEGYRTDAPDEKLPHRPAVEVELADAIVRILDLAGALDLDIGGALAEKIIYNGVRVDHKPEARSSKGGKKF